MNISHEDFKKLDIRIGKIRAAERIPGSDKLLKLTVDFGVTGEPPAAATREIVSGIAEWYTSEDLVGREAPFVFNLAPRVFRGVESQGMILAANADGKPVLLAPDRAVPPGSRVL
jgi:methionyl-tRNA synthetase